MIESRFVWLSTQFLSQSLSPSFYWSNFPFLVLLQSFIFPFVYLSFFLSSTIFLHFFYSPPPPPNLEFLSYIFVYLLISKHTLFKFYCKTASEELTLQQALLQVSFLFSRAISIIFIVFIAYLLWYNYSCIMFCMRNKKHSKKKQVIDIFKENLTKDSTYSWYQYTIIGHTFYTSCLW